MTLSWVIGSNGLLGTAICRAQLRFASELFNPGIRFTWLDKLLLQDQIASSVNLFALQAQKNSRWEIYWAAGIGNMSSSECDLQAETDSLNLLVNLISQNSILMSMEGVFTFASSAGAIYAGSTDQVITEHSAVMPTNAYGREKYKQENLLKNFSILNKSVKVFVARISTLYGPGQSQNKPQGLLTHIARQLLRNKTIQIYVPFDTIRDYIATDDAADVIGRAIKEVKNDQNFTLKIIASEHPTTIAEILSIFKRLSRRAPRIVTSTSKLTNTYSRSVLYRSIVPPIAASKNSRSLPIGISQIINAERKAMMLAGNFNDRRVR